MPFIRFARDRRGYETTYVMHGYRPAQGPGRTRVLYLFRSPAHVRIGRSPLDDEAREALEHTHPDLSFDWYSLGKELSHPPPEERPVPRQIRRADRPAPPPSPPQRLEDSSVLGLSLGAAAAGALRTRYAELLQRITRRARTPEDRDRLMDAAQRLNPDDWSDDAAVKANMASVYGAWEAINAELPQRRRGRRGGRGRTPEGADEPIRSANSPSDGREAGNADTSAIIERTGGGNARATDEEMDGADRGAGRDVDSDRDGADPEPTD